MKGILLFVGLFALPAISFASVQITEIMYDVPGGDAGREWIEITNTGTEAVDISKYKLTEGGTNHVLAMYSGDPVLLPGVSAILADDPVKFKLDWPSYAGVLINTVLSLSNTGETIAIKNASSSTEDSVSYTASMGAAGDGASLHRLQNTFISAVPNLGIFPGTLTSVVVPAKTAPTKSMPVSLKKNTTKISPASAHLVQKSVDASVQQIPVVQNVQHATSQGISSTLLWVLGLIAIISLGVAGAVYASVMRSPNTVALNATSPSSEEFQIIEE